MNGVQKIFANGSGTKEDPYILSSIEDLKKFADTVTNTGITYKDQYLKVAEGTVFDLSAEQWKSIGSSSKRFMGTFDGNGATVKGLTDSFFGGIVGYTNSSKGTWVIENCYNGGDITATGEKPDSKPDNKPGNADTIHPQSGQSSNAVETGDSTNVVLWITVFVIAAGMLVGEFICMKRRKNK